MGIIAVCGNDEGRVSQRALEVFSSLLPEGGGDFAQEIIDGEVANAEGAYEACMRCIEALETLPFFGGKKVVWLRGVTFLGSDVTSEAEHTKKGVLSLIDCCQKGLPQGVDFLVSATALRKARPMEKFLKKQATLELYQRPDASRDGWQNAMKGLIVNETSRRGMECQVDALELFVNRIGCDTRLMINECEKLDIALQSESTSPRSIRVEHVRMWVTESHAGVVFEVGNALSQRNAPLAMQLIDKLLRLDTSKNPVGILRASIIPTVRALFFSKMLSKELGNIRSYQQFNAAITALPAEKKAWLPRKKDGTVSAYQLFLAMGGTRHYSLGELQSALESCLEADKLLVTTSLEPRGILHGLMASICS